MLPPLLDNVAGAPSSRDRWWWAFLGLLVVGQLFGFWMLCQNQVAQAEMRRGGLYPESMVAQQFTGADARPDKRSAQNLLAADAGVRQTAGTEGRAP
jgi:hypothetical protein